MFSRGLLTSLVLDEVVAFLSEETGLQTYLTHSSVTGRLADASQLCDRVRRFSWAKAYDQISSLAAVIAIDPSGPNSAQVRRLTLEPLRHLGADVPHRAQIVDGLDFLGHSVALFHEQLVYFLEALAILYGADTGETPSATELSLWMLYANDHLATWLDGTSLSDSLEDVVAQLAPLTRFNTSRDLVRATARAKLILKAPLPQGLYSDPQKWQQLQVRALQRPVDEFFDCFVAPLVVMSTHWGTARGPGKIDAPALDPSTWFSASSLPAAEGEAFLRSLSVDRDGARRQLEQHLDNDGLPRSTRLFYDTPFIQLPSGWLAAASPWAIRELLTTGIWARFMRASKEDGKGRDWSSAFGLLVELWCREVAQAAASAKRFKGKLLVSAAPGDANEIEDVVVKEGHSVALFSVKSRLVKAEVSRGLLSKQDVIALYNSFLFDQKRSEGTGALRLLDAKVNSIRAGAFPALSRTMKVYPVLVTYDSLGENSMLYRWVHQRCQEEGLLQQKDVAPVTLATVDTFEMLMGLGASGVGVIETLLRKTSAENRFLDFDRLLYAIAGKRQASTRLPIIERKFDAIMNAVSLRLFGKPLR